VSRLSKSLVAALVLPLSAHAERLELLGPDSTVSPDGFDVAVRLTDDRGRPLDAKGAALEVTGGTAGPPRAEGPVRVVTITPSDRSVKVKATAGAATATKSFAVGPPAAGVRLKLEPAAPVKNRDTSAELTIEMRNAEGHPDPESAPPVLRANVGSIEALQKVGPGIYKARYVLPTTRFPEVAVVVAFSAWPHPQSVHGAFGALRVPLAAAVELPGKTEANADLTLLIANKPFGPVRTGPDGRFKIPIVVPPGYGMAKGTAVDRLGNKRTNPIDLALPPTDQLACVVSPTQLPADGQSRARVLCATSDPYGNIATGAKVSLSSMRGRLSAPRLLDNGVSEWTWIAPAELGDGKEELFAVWKQGAISAREDLHVSLVQGPASSATVNASDTFVHVGGSLPFTAVVKDAQNRPRAGANLALVSGVGALEDVKETAPGKIAARWRSPGDVEVGATALSVRAWGPKGLEPGRIACWAEGGRLFAAVTDLAGLPVPSQPLKVGARDVMTDDEGVVDLGPIGADVDLSVRHRDWPGLSAGLHVREGGKVVFPRATRPGSAPASLEVTLAPKVEVVVRVAVQGHKVSYWAETVDGQLLEDRPLQVELSQGRAGPTTKAAGRQRFEVTGLKGPATVSVVDPETQMFVMAEVRP